MKPIILLWYVAWMKSQGVVSVPNFCGCCSLPGWSLPRQSAITSLTSAIVLLYRIGQSGVAELHEDCRRTTRTQVFGRPFVQKPQAGGNVNVFSRHQKREVSAKQRQIDMVIKMTNNVLQRTKNVVYQNCDLRSVSCSCYCFIKRVDLLYFLPDSRLLR